MYLCRGIAGDSFYALGEYSADGAGSILSVPTDPAWILDDPSDLFSCKLLVKHTHFSF